MVKASKSTEKPPATPAAKAPKATKATKAAAPAPAPVNEIVAAPAATEEAEAPSIVFKMAEFSANLQQLMGLFSTVKKNFQTLEKAVAKEMKAAAKASSKKKRSNVNRKPSGFVKPAVISDELATFLGKARGSEMARTEVSSLLTAYIRAHKLQDKDNGRIIHPDVKLNKLLKVEKDTELTYFNLQRYMKPHFKKADVAA